MLTEISSRGSSSSSNSSSSNSSSSNSSSSNSSSSNSSRSSNSSGGGSYGTGQNYNFEPGDVICRYLENGLGWLGYKHYGIYVGGGEVIHYACRNGSSIGMILRRESVEVFANNQSVWKKTWRGERDKADIVQTALDVYNGRDYSADWDDYNAFSLNCEHFASYCATGILRSRQSIFTS